MTSPVLFRSLSNFEMIKSGYCFYEFRWIAGHNHIRGDILGNNASRADNGILTDRDSAQQGGTGTNGGAFFHQCRNTGPVLFRLQMSVFVGRPGIKIVGEGDIVADKYIVFYYDTFADEGVAGDLAVFADGRLLLDLDEGAYFGVVSDTAAVQVDMAVDLDIVAEFYIFGYCFHKRIGG